MREIKFRAWDGLRMTTSGIMFNTSTGCLEIPTAYSLNLEEIPKEKRMILMQYTGLKDKNGKEIYEGDVLKCFDLEYLDMPDFKGVVAINDCEFFLKEKNNEPIELWSDGTNDYFTMSLIQTDECCEVIGNIYENPELTNKQNH